jgi:misacylated tRNA(Ala) deacylase
MRGGTRLHYLAGRRVLRRLAAALDRERALADRLSCGPEDHPAAVDRLHQELREDKRQRRALATELAQHLGRELAAQPGPVASLHRPDGDMELLRGVARAVQDQPRAPSWVLLTAGDAPKTARGVFLLIGPESRIAEVGPRVAVVLEGRGGGRGNTYQGKAGDFFGIAAAISILEQLDP